MNVILMVYVKDAFKEFILPVTDNANYSIVLHKDVFHLEKDIEVSLEVVEHKWRFLHQEEYMIKKQDVVHFGQALQDGDVLELVSGYGARVSIIVIESTKSFQVFKKYDISCISDITVGKDETNMIQYNFSGLISRQHIKISHVADGFTIQDTSVNGAFLNSRRITNGTKLVFGDYINIFGLHLIYLGNVLGVAGLGDSFTVNEHLLREYIQREVNVAPGLARFKRAGKNYFHRSPRNMPQLYQETIEIETPPAPRRSKKPPLFMTIGPAFSMAVPMLLGSLLAIVGSNGSRGGIYLFSGIITALSSALIGVTWAIVNIKYAKKEEKEEEEYRFGAYSNYLIKIADFISEKYEENRVLMNDAYPSTEVCCTYDKDTTELWNRNSNHDDFLFVRLGIGSQPFQANIQIPKKKFTLVEDFLAEKPEVIYKNYHMLHNVPVGVDLLKSRLLGIVGGAEKRGTIELVHTIITQIAANNSYTDVKIIVVYNEKKEEDKKSWAFAKWLPHLWSEDKKTRFFATNQEEASDVFYELTNLLRVREENASQKKEAVIRPHYVLFVVNPELLEGELIAKYVFGCKKEYGLTTFLLADKCEELPNTCENIIQNDEEYKGIYNVSDGNSNKRDAVYDHVSIDKLELFTRRLARIEVNELESGGEIPNSLDFFEMYGVSSLEELNVLDRWRKNRTYDSMRALIGKKAGGNNCYLDIHEKYHGPHGLIAGTTGSGKSETLQTYMLSLAMNFSPYDVGFFIIDFKGGGMANLFSDLPHMIGQISNLSGNQVHRAMVSIKSENMRRQRVFNEHGVNNINLYTRLLKNNEASIPIPHLFIIIDEFAELKREEPEFMKELISVAQVGRSLGVHLILATQKPSGTVDDNIWSNTKFRLCLRVQDRQDSNDMLHKPDAAYITQSGRCYLQVGNDEIFELFQSGWSGATYDESMMNQSAIATMLTVNGKAAIIGSRTKLKQKEANTKQWFLSLAECVDMAAKNLNISIMESHKSSYVLTQLADEVYSVMEQRGIDYADSKYNRIRLEDFIRLWKEDELSLEDNIVHIIKNASLEGKKLPETKEKTQLDAVVEYLGDIAQKHQYTHNLQLWMPVLPAELYLAELFGYEQEEFNGSVWTEEKEKWNLEAIIGLCDDPENQSQMPLVINLAENGHHAICGSVMSGKSTFLQSVIYSFINRYTPEHVNIYGLDFSSQMLGAFEKSAHVGGIMYENDVDKISKFFHMLEGILEERKKLFRGGNYSQYVQVNGIVVPSIIVAIDNFANFREKTGDSYEEILIKLSRDGAGYGIFLMISSAGFGSGEIPSRIADNLRTVICLEMGDKYKYGDLLGTLHFDVLPEGGIKGRGLASANGSILEFQTALSLKAEDDYNRSEKIIKRCEQMNQAWTGKKARKVPEIPEQPILSEFSELEEYKQMIEEARQIPIGYNKEDASVAGLDLSDIYSYFIVGKKRTGKSNLLKILIHGASQLEADVCIMDMGSGRLRKTAQELEVNYIDTEEALFQYWKELIPTFKERNQRKKRYVEEGLEEHEIYEEMRVEKPIFIFISNLAEFINNIYKPKEGVGEMKGFMENISEKGRLHNIYFIAAINMEDIRDISYQPVYTNFENYKKGIHLGGNIAAQRMFSFDNIPYMEQTKSTKPGIGLTPDKEDENKARTIIIPLARG